MARNLQYHECDNCGKRSSCGQDPKAVRYRHTCKFCLTKNKDMKMGTWKPEEITAYRQELKAFREKNPLPAKVPRSKKAEGKASPKPAIASSPAPTVPRKPTPIAPLTA